MAEEIRAILEVEDDAQIAELFSGMLSGNGATVPNTREPGMMFKNPVSFENLKRAVSDALQGKY